MSLSIYSARRVNSKAQGSFRMVQATCGQSDLMTLRLDDNGRISFMRSPGVYSRPQGSDYLEMLRIAQELV